MAPSLKYVTVEVLDETVALVKFNNPQTGNSLQAQQVADMVSAMTWVINEQDVRIIIVTGEGRFFSTGMHLDDKQDMEMLSFKPDSAFYQLNRILINCKKILIAAVNGPAVGYGVSSLALFDLVYSVPDAYFFTPFVKWGMAAEGASSVTFPRIMGHQKAASLFLAADRMTAQEAERLGLITKIMPKEDFLQSVIQIARRIAQSPPGSLIAVKELMRQPVREAMLEANDRECDVLQNDRISSGEPQKAIAEFRGEQERKRRSKSKL